MNSTQLQRFAVQAGRSRADLWPATFTLSTDTASRKLSLGASPVSRSRQPNEHRTGWVQVTSRVIVLPRSFLATPWSLTVAMGSVFTCTEDPLNPSNVGTTWSVKEINDSNGGSELRLTVWRQD